MVNQVVFRQRALWAYELGRLRRAGRITLVIALLVLLTIWETGRASPALGIGFALTIASVVSRWWHRRRGNDVTVGLWAGLIPLGTSLLVCRIGIGCSATVSIILCGAAGAAAGIALERHADRDEAGRLARWLTCAAVVGLTSSLGCGALNGGAVVGILVGISGGSLLSAMVRTLGNPLSRNA